MPTLNKRVSLTLEPHRHDLLRRLAGLQRVSMSKVVVSILEEMYPVLERLCVSLESAKRAQESTRDGLKRAADQAISELEPLLMASLNQFDLFIGQIERVADGVREATAPAVEAGTPSADRPSGRAKSKGGSAGGIGESPGGTDPPIVTRGSGSKWHIPQTGVKTGRSKG